MVPGNRSDGTSGGRRIALKIQYDGTAFNGWQIQDGGRTVQDEIERALGVFFREKIRITASGRTDSGVHSLGQIAHFDIKNDVDLPKLCISLNGILPKDVSVINSYLVNENFHARFSAVQREYTYLIFNSPLRSPFMQYRAMWIKDKIDIEYLKKTTGYLVGEHDFAAFCKKISSDCNTIRKIEAIGITTFDKIIIINIKGNAFLHNMVRIIVGTIVDMYKNSMNPDYILEIINSKNRENSGPTAPPYGLYLMNVRFDPPLEQYESAYW